MLSQGNISMQVASETVKEDASAPVVNKPDDVDTDFMWQLQDGQASCH